MTNAKPDVAYVVSFDSSLAEIWMVAVGGVTTTPPLVVGGQDFAEDGILVQFAVKKQGTSAEVLGELRRAEG